MYIYIYMDVSEDDVSCQDCFNVIVQCFYFSIISSDIPYIYTYMYTWHYLVPKIEIESNIVLQGTMVFVYYVLQFYFGITISICIILPPNGVRRKYVEIRWLLLLFWWLWGCI